MERIREDCTNFCRLPWIDQTLLLAVRILGPEPPQLTEEELEPQEYRFGPARSTPADRSVATEELEEEPDAPPSYDTWPVEARIISDVDA